MTPQAVAQAMRRMGLPADVEEAPARLRVLGARDDERAGLAAAPRAVGVRSVLSAEQLPEALRTAHDQLGFTMLSSITATDEGDHFALLYHLVRPLDPEHPGFLMLTVRALKDAHPDGPVVPSAVAVYPGANLQEREIFDLMGVRFRGHPKLTRVLTWTGFAGHPLRKDYEPIDEEIPWRLAGLRGPDGTLVGDEDGRMAEEERAVWEAVDVDTPLAGEPPTGEATT